MSKTFKRAISCTLISEKTVLACFHVFSNSSLQFLDTRWLQHNPALNRINLAECEQGPRRWVPAIEHLITSRDIAVAGAVQSLTAGSTELLVARIKAAQT